MIFKYIKPSKFFPKYCPHIKNYMQKIRGVNSKGKSISFSKNETIMIIRGFDKFQNDIKANFNTWLL